MTLNQVRLSIAALSLLALVTFTSRSQADGRVATSLAPAATVQSAKEVYQLDLAHSTIGFNVRHLVINNIPGRFKEFSGTIQYDAADVTRSAVEFTAKVASVDTGVAQRDDHLRTADFFDVAKYPELTFKSKKIERKGKDAFVAHGTFTLHGVSKEIAIPFKLAGPIKDPWGKQRLGVDAGLTINRQDYGVAWSQTLDGGGLVVGNDVNITLLLEAVKQ